MLCALLFTLPPDVRYHTRNIFPLAFIPGPIQPKSVQSYLIPLINEVANRLHGDGLFLRFYDSVEGIHTHLNSISGDQMSICRVAGLLGPNS